MSKLNKNIIAVAIAAAFAAPAAHAVTISPVAAEANTVNQNQFASSTAAASVAPIRVRADASDNYLGRTVGYNIRVTLPAGVTLASAVVAANVVELGGAAEATLVTGTGAAGSNSFLVNVAPNAAGTQVGEGFTVSGLSIAGTSLANGGTVTADVAVVDPTTGVALSSNSGTILRAIQGLDVDFTATASGAASKIDVGSDKRFFVEAPNWAVGGGDAGEIFEAGMIEIGEAEGVAPWLVGQGATATITLSGTDFRAFRTATGTGNNADAGVYLGELKGVVSANGSSVLFANVPVTAQQQGWSVFFDANHVTAIQPSAITASVTVTPGSGYSTYSEDGVLAPLRYNGAELTFYNVNPASNPRAQSFIRLTNNSSVACAVSLVGVDDNGNDGDSAVRVNVPVRGSVTLNSNHLENGSSFSTGAFGQGAGRWVVTATGECSSLVGSALNRNLEDGTVTNLTHVERSEAGEIK